MQLCVEELISLKHLIRTCRIFSTCAYSPLKFLIRTTLNQSLPKSEVDIFKSQAQDLQVRPDQNMKTIEETSSSLEENDQRVNMSDANFAQDETDVPRPQPGNIPTESIATDTMTSQSASTPEEDPFTLPDFLFYGSFLNYEQILFIPFEHIPLADTDDIMRTAAQYTIDDIVQHVNRNNVDDATVVLTAKIVEDMIKRSIKRLAKSRATTIDKVKKEFEAKQKENGIVRGKYTNHRVNHAEPDAIYHPSGFDGGF